MLPEAAKYKFKATGLKDAHCYRSGDKSTILINVEEMAKNKELFKRKLLKLVLYDIWSINSL